MIFIAERYYKEDNEVLQGELLDIEVKEEPRHYEITISFEINDDNYGIKLFKRENDRSHEIVKFHIPDTDTYERNGGQNFNDIQKFKINIDKRTMRWSLP